jgi:hypothetical protein
MIITVDNSHSCPVDEEEKIGMKPSKVQKKSHPYHPADQRSTHCPVPNEDKFIVKTKFPSAQWFISFL